MARGRPLGSSAATSVGWGGISSVQLGLPVIWTHARERGFGLADVARWMSASPARLAGLAAKGAIAPGYDADLVAFAPDEQFVVTPDQLLTRHKLTPYAGQELSGVVRRTWLRGAPVDAGPPVPGGCCAERGDSDDSRCERRRDDRRR